MHATGGSWDGKRVAVSTLGTMEWCGRLVVLPLLLASLTGCGVFRHRPPAWVNNPKQVYADNKYLVAVGEGDTRSAAENAADANLSRIFEARIIADERLLETINETNRAFNRTTDFVSAINILSAQTLYNIQHAEAWKDRNGRYHAVAYIDRRETARIYREKIDALSTSVDFMLAQVSQTEYLLKKYALLRTANRAAAENAVLLEQLKIIHPPTGSATAPSYSMNDLRRALADTAKQIRVQIEIEGDTGGRMTSCIEELVTRYGFVVGKPAVLDITGRVSINDAGMRVGNLVFFRYELAVQIKDSTDTVLATINNKGREAHQSQAEAMNRSFRTLERAITAEGTQRLDAFFDSLVEQPR